MQAHQPGLRNTAAADADLWAAMRTYLDEWRDETTVSWVKSYTEDGGAKTSEHEQQNKRADDDAEKAYAHPDSSLYRAGHCSQFNTVWDATIDGKVAGTKRGPLDSGTCKRGSTSILEDQARGRCLGGEHRHQGYCPARTTKK